MSSAVLVFVLFEFINLILSLIITVLLHESGHLLGGLISGYSFSQIRFFGIRILKIDTGICIIFDKLLPLGQCIMYSDNPDRNPFLLLLGGGVVNLLSGLIMAVYGVVSGIRTFIIISPYAIFGLIFGAINLLGKSPHCDGRQFRECRADKRDLIAYNNMMNISHFLCCGMPPSEIPEKYINVFSKCSQSSISADMEAFGRYCRELRCEGDIGNE